MKIVAQKFQHDMICEFDSYDEMVAHLAEMMQQGWELHKADNTTRRIYYRKVEDVMIRG